MFSFCFVRNITIIHLQTTEPRMSMSKQVQVPLQSGLLYGRLPGYKVKDWCMVYMELMSTHLCIFEGHEDTAHPRRHLRDLGIRRSDMVGEEKSKRKDYRFYVQRVDGRYQFKCETAEERGEWILQLQRVVNNCTERPECQTLPPSPDDALNNHTSTENFNPRTNIFSAGVATGNRIVFGVHRNHRVGVPASTDGTFRRPANSDIATSLRSHSELDVRTAVQRDMLGTQELEKYKWFWGYMSRQECENKLYREGKMGSFVIRINANGHFVLSIWHVDGIYHYKIIQQRGMFCFQKTAEDVQTKGYSLVNFLGAYMKNFVDGSIRPFGGQLELVYHEPWNPPEIKDMEEFGRRLKKKMEKPIPSPAVKQGMSTPSTQGRSRQELSCKKNVPANLEKGNTLKKRAFTVSQQSTNLHAHISTNQSRPLPSVSALMEKHTTAVPRVRDPIKRKQTNEPTSSIEATQRKQPPPTSQKKPLTPKPTCWHSEHPKHSEAYPSSHQSPLQVSPPPQEDPQYANLEIIAAQRDRLQDSDESYENWNPIPKSDFSDGNKQQEALFMSSPVQRDCWGSAGTILNKVHKLTLDPQPKGHAVPSFALERKQLTTSLEAAQRKQPPPGTPSSHEVEPSNRKTRPSQYKHTTQLHTHQALQQSSAPAQDEPLYANWIIVSAQNSRLQ